MVDKTLLGNEGEDLAVQYLNRSGYIVLERNYRYKRCEIDIIAQKDKTLVFVEVKARSSNEFGNPEDAVNKKKQAKILEGAEAYIFEKNWHGPIRFDIAAIDLKTSDITYFEDAFG